MVPSVTPQLVGNNALVALRLAIADPGRFACEPKVDGVRGLVVYQPDGWLETRNRSGQRRVLTPRGQPSRPDSVAWPTVSRSCGTAPSSTGS
jgi:hypothetical protein